MVYHKSLISIIFLITLFFFSHLSPFNGISFQFALVLVAIIFVEHYNNYLDGFSSFCVAVFLFILKSFEIIPQLFLFFYPQHIVLKQSRLSVLLDSLSLPLESTVFLGKDLFVQLLQFRFLLRLCLSAVYPSINTSLFQIICL